MVADAATAIVVIRQAERTMLSMVITLRVSDAEQ
jgi:hypothetical protein